MKPRRIIASVVLALLLTGSGGMILWQHVTTPDLDQLSKEEPPFNEMRMPARDVEAWLAEDKASIAVLVRDAEGTDFKFAFPYEHSGGNGGSYKRAFHGSVYANRPEAVPFKDPARAKKVCLQFMKEYNDEVSMMYHQLAETRPSRFMKKLRAFIPRY